ncbi:hypothetical protein F5Y19DRAFT_485946 [Xylariaceae sp. FL1651]|nr:hypothetical protein F5Y19DRAFT_485946 [Xylariaceae sp. FL1651]
MVGVPGKYKGCNTCRARRVKCDNTRPFCKKCTDYGRECGGYERETVFIVGTQDDKGRVGSHPPRSIQRPRSTQPEASTQPAAKLEFVATEPLQPAWNETVLLNSGGNSHLLRIFARHADLESALQYTDSSSHRNEVSLSLLDSHPLAVAPTFREEIFSMKCSCFVHLLKDGSDSTTGSHNGLCLFLYQQNSSAMYSNEPPWNSPAALADAVREPGPAAYQSFPAHHFFARIYRPSAIWAALLNRQPTFLCNPEWTVIPWEHSPRTSLDDLLDIVVLLPSIFLRADCITQLEPSVERLLDAKEILTDCVNIETQFDIWFSVVQQTARSSFQSVPFWVEDSTTSGSQAPFNDLLSFASPLLCLVHIYYWTVLISFHQCINALLRVILDSTGEGSSGLKTAPNLPPGFDLRKYQHTETRKLAAKVCRSLDFALNTTEQPDLLVAPVWIVGDFYNGMARFVNSELESAWIVGFQGRLEIRGREMSMWLQEKRWAEIGQFG